MTRAELLEVVYRFYARVVPAYDDRYFHTEERLRLAAAARRGVDEYPTWEAMLDRLYPRYGVQNESMFLFTGGVDPAYSARVYVPGASGQIAMTFHVSLLGPYYGIHRTGEPEEEPTASEIAREIEATYPGYRTIPPEIGDYVVPDVAFENGLFGETIYMCLFSEVWGWAGVYEPGASSD